MARTLNRRALLEPDDTVDSGHTRRGRPRTLMHEHRRSRELNVRRNPLDHRGDDSDAKRAANPRTLEGLRECVPELS